MKSSFRQIKRLFSSQKLLLGLLFLLLLLVATLISTYQANQKQRLTEKARAEQKRAEEISLTYPEDKWQRIKPNSYVGLPMGADGEIDFDKYLQGQGPDSYTELPTVAAGDIDLDVTYIGRTPRYYRYCVNYPNDIPKLCSGTENYKRWPTVGETVTYTAHIINKKGVSSPGFSFQWLVNGAVVASGDLPSLGAGQETTTEYSRSWPSLPETIQFKIDPSNSIPETVETNNTLSITSHDLTISIWVEQGLYDIFNNTLNLAGSYSFEDWIQAQFAKMNERFSQAQYPVVPNGMLNRVRIDKIVVAENLDGSSSPMRSDPHFDLIDGRWPLGDSDSTNNAGRGGAWQSYVNKFVNRIDWGLIHELSHQLGIVDLYRMRLFDDISRNCGIQVQGLNGNIIPGCPGHPDYSLPPMFAHPGIMAGGDTSPYNDGTYFESHTAGGMNAHYTHRRGYYGEYLFDTPANNYLKVLDTSGNPIIGAEVKLFQKDKETEYIDNTPEITGTTNEQGIIYLPNRPVNGVTTATGHTLRDNPFGQIKVVGTNGTMLVQVFKNDKEYYGWLFIIDLNLAYWSGNRDSATYAVTVFVAKPPTLRPTPTNTPAPTLTPTPTVTPIAYETVIKNVDINSEFVAYNLSKTEGGYINFTFFDKRGNDVAFIGDSIHPRNTSTDVLTRSYVPIRVSLVNDIRLCCPNYQGDVMVVSHSFMEYPGPTPHHGPPIAVDTHNDPPVFNPIGDKTVGAGDLLEFGILAEDPDDWTIPWGQLEYSVIAKPEGASFNPETRIFSWTPALSDMGDHQVTFQVQDKHLDLTVGNIVQETIAIRVTFPVPTATPTLTPTPTITPTSTPTPTFTPTPTSTPTPTPTPIPQFSLNVITPNGGEAWNKGQTYTIKWEFSSTGELLDNTTTISLRYDNGTREYLRIVDRSANLKTIIGVNQFNWTIPADIPNGNYRIGIQVEENFRTRFDQSDQDFTIMSKQITVVDDVGDVGLYSSIAIGRNYPAISYYDSTNKDLKFVKCGDSACSSHSGNMVTILDEGNVGMTSSLVLNTSENPMISYDRSIYDGSNGLIVIRCRDKTCSSPSIKYLIDKGNVGYYSSLAIDKEGKPVISYYSNNRLKVAKCGDPTCSSREINITELLIGNFNDYGKTSSMIVGADDFPVISFYYRQNDTDGFLGFIKCMDKSCSSTGPLTVIDPVVGWYTSTSIAMGTDGNPVISYYDANRGDLKLVKCGSPDCFTGNIITTVDSEGDVGERSSIAIGTDGNPMISYYGEYWHQGRFVYDYLKLAKCGNPACSSGNIITTVDSGGGRVGWAPSIAIGTDGNPVISYYDFTNGDLKVAKIFLR